LIIPLNPDDMTGSNDLAAALLKLNNDHAVELSLADPARLAWLVGSAFYAKRVGDAEAMLIAFDHMADYQSPNFLWFRDRYARFVYVDRIVTAAAARGRGLARSLYLDLFEHARAAGHERIVCEVNSDPPNPASEAFHRSLGFRAVGEAMLENGKKVSYLELTLANR